MTSGRRAGITVPLFSLRSAADCGIGEIADLAPFVDWAVRAGQGLVALLPLGELQPGEASPYNAASSFAIDPLFIRLADVSELAGHSVAPPGELGGRPRVDRERVRAWKEPFFAEAFEAFRALPQGHDRVRSFHAFQQRNADWLPDHALYRALAEDRQWESWRRWPKPLRRRDETALSRARNRLHERTIFFRYLQFLADEQWSTAREGARRAGVLLMGDLPFAPAENSADVWANQDEFDVERTVGAPPDPFSATGQRWGLPMYRWEAIRKSDWRWFRARFRRTAALYDLFRIDHVVGLFRTFSFAGDDADGGFEPADEAAQRRQGREILALSREAARPAEPVAEDLGVIPDFVRETMTLLGIPGYKVFRWEQRDGRFLDPAIYPECSIATTGTHDTDTLPVWWSTLGEEERDRVLMLLPKRHGPSTPGARPVLGRSRGLRSSDTPGPRASRGTPPREALPTAVRLAILEMIYRSPSRYAILPIQDLFGWEERINLPASVGGDNWTFRLPIPAERLESGQIRDIIDAAGRFGTMAGA